MINWNLFFNDSMGLHYAEIFVDKKLSGRSFLRAVRSNSNESFTEIYRAIKMYGTENVRERCRKALSRRTKV